MPAFVLGLTALFTAFIVVSKPFSTVLVAFYLVLSVMLADAFWWFSHRRYKIVINQLADDFLRRHPYGQAPVRILLDDDNQLDMTCEGSSHSTYQLEACFAYSVTPESLLLFETEITARILPNNAYVEGSQAELIKRLRGAGVKSIGKG